MLNITNCCFNKKSEINVCFLLNTYSFSTMKFNFLSDLIIVSPILEHTFFLYISNPFLSLAPKTV